MIREIFIGYEPREAEAFAVARESIRRHGGSKVIIRGLVLADMQRLGWYTRPTKMRLGRLVDELSITEDYKGEMSTEFANSRFLIPHIAADRNGWVLFVDCDIMVRGSLVELFDLCKRHDDKAMLCVKHDYVPQEHFKMNNQVQTDYFRKNWSSVMLWNLQHPAHQALTVDAINAVPGRDLHRMYWLKDEEIGALPAGWNWLARVSPGMPSEQIKLVHWTLGGPWMAGLHDEAFADEWREYRDEWARSTHRGGRTVAFPNHRRQEAPAWLGG